MAESGLTQVAPSTKKHLRHKVESELCEFLHIIPNDKGKLLVYPDNLSMDELVKVCQKQKDELRKHKSSISEDIILQVALKIRGDIRNQDITQAWPPHASDLEMMNSIKLSLIYLAKNGRTEKKSKKKKRNFTDCEMEVLLSEVEG